MYYSVVPSPPLDDRATTDPSPSVRRQGRNRESDPAADIPSGPTEETLPTWTLDVINPPSQEAIGSTGVLDGGFDIYPSFSVSYFDQHIPPPAVHGFVSQTMDQPVHPYPVGQTVNALADGGSLSFFSEMERQSALEMVSADQSPSGPSSALDLDEPTAWSGPDHTPPASDHWDHSSFRLSADPLEAIYSHGSIESTLADGETTQQLGPADGDLNVASELDTTTLLPPPQQDMPTGWVKIPQGNYIHSQINPFPRWEKVTFSVKSTPGFNLKDALRRVYKDLNGRDDYVLQGAKGPVSCRLLFPGYPMDPSRKQIAVKDWKKERGSITKSKLAYEVARRIKEYLDTFAAVPIIPSVDVRWTIGRGFMRLEKMYLVSVTQVSRGSLQPEIWVDRS